MTLRLADLPEYADAAQVAEVLGVTAETVRAECRAGVLTHYRLGDGRGVIRIHRDDVAAYLEKRKCRAETQGRASNGGPNGDSGRFSGSRKAVAAAKRRVLTALNTLGASSNKSSPQGASTPARVIPLKG